MIQNTWYKNMSFLFDLYNRVWIKITTGKAWDVDSKILMEDLIVKNSKKQIWRDNIKGEYYSYKLSSSLINLRE